MRIRKKKKILNPHSENTWTKIANTMNEVCVMLDKLYDINCGGCCYIAYCLAKLLRKDKIPYSVEVISFHEMDEYNDCNDFNNLDWNFNHYGICLGSTRINITEEDVASSEFILNFDNVSPKIIKSHYDSGYWNDCYDIDKNDFIWEILRKFYYECTEDLRER